MRSVVDWYDRNRRSIWLCIVLNLLLLLIYLLLMRPVFDSNDDMNIAFFVNMARPIQDPYLLFENVLLGHICSFLYRVTNMLPWYGLLQYFGLFCAFTGMTWVIQQLFSTGSAAVLSSPAEKHICNCEHPHQGKGAGRRPAHPFLVVTSGG